METLRAQLLRIQQQLSGLSASQKMLTVSLVAIMVITIAWWARFAGTAEMEPVFDYSIPSEEMSRIRTTLTSANIPAQIIGDRVMVPAEKKVEAMMQLAESDTLPSNAAAGWDEMFKLMSAWDSSQKTKLIENKTRERVLSQLITRYFKGVAKASVVINSHSERRIGAPLEPSASVLITTRGREVNAKQIAASAAATVASAVPGLAPSRVTVVVDGRRHRAGDQNDLLAGAGADADDRILSLERSYADKIAGMLGPGALVAVTVEVDMSSIQQQSEIYDAAKFVSKERVIETKSSEKQQSTPPASEPGALPNAQLVLPNQPTPGGGSADTTETTRTENQIFPSVTKETTSKPGGQHTVVSAAVRLPRSQFVRKFKASNTSAKDPDEASLQPLIDLEMPQIRATVLRTVNLKSEDALAVSTYDDEVLPMLAAAEQVGSTGGGGVGNLLKGHGKELALGVLAAISLFMVSMMVRRSAPVAVVSAPEEPKETPHLESEEIIAGIVGGESGATLDGMEVDPENVKAQQMVEQVSTMVKDDPEAAANMVKRWLNRT